MKKVIADACIQGDRMVLLINDQNKMSATGNNSVHPHRQ
jgi:hypothetical protein